MNSDLTAKFEFGENWLSYSSRALNKELIESGRLHFRTLCADIFFENKSFLDIGFGQGLALFFASELGARVTGIDSDPVNLLAVRETAKFFSQCEVPTTIEESILNRDFVERHKSQFDIVYSWGVLHHTGDLLTAIKNTVKLVKPGGHLVIAIYNRHWSAGFWKCLKWAYSKSSQPVKDILLNVFYYPLFFAAWVLTGQNPLKPIRGMDFRHDLRDWIGGYPYQYMTKEEILAEIPADFELTRYIKPLVPTGNHQLVFRKTG